ncbi:MAG: hypothetical protein DWQ29_08145, partial [Planctomycetota bacterium]
MRGCTTPADRPRPENPQQGRARDVDPPSSQLIAALSRLGVYRPRDLKRCRGRVRRLARDLPTFDSVWIDALVQIR